MFATRAGNVRRNSLADFESINRNGKIAMKLDEGDRIVRVARSLRRPERRRAARPTAATEPSCIRFPAGRTVGRAPVQGPRSTGVRGIRLDEGDEVISMAILRHVEATPGERAAYLKQALAMRRAQGAEVAERGAGGRGRGGSGGEAASTDAGALSPSLAAHEQFVLTVSERGFGKRSSSYEYRISGRGGKGIVAMIVNERNGRLVASFPVEDSDQIMLVTDGGKLIRCPVDDVRIAGRNTQGVRIFKTEDDEKVVSVERIPEDEQRRRRAGDGEGEREAAK